MMEHLPPIPNHPAPGTRWRHFKGTEYEIVALARDCGEPTLILVVYKDDDGHVWVRERSNFLSMAANAGANPRFLQL